MKFEKPIIFFLIILSAALNLISLFSRSIKLDEAQSIWVATKSVPMLFQINASDVSVPLYTLLLHFWIQLLGTDIITVRLLSVIFFILTIPVIYRLIKEAGGLKIALLATAIFSLSPFILWYSNEARAYSLFTLTVCLSHLYYLRMKETDGQTGKTGYFLSSFLGVFTHYFFFFLLLTQFFYGLLVFRKDKRRFFLNFLFLLTTLFFIFLPWLSYVVTQGLASNTQPLLSPPTAFSLISLFVDFIFGFQSPALSSFIIGLWPLVLIILFFIFTHRPGLELKNSSYFILTAFLPVLIVFTISLLKPIFLARYLILTTPALFTLIAWVLTGFVKKSSLLSLGVLVPLFFLFNFQNGSPMTPVREDYTEVTRYLEKNAAATDIIAVSAPFTIYPIEYSYDGIARIDTLPLWGRYAAGPIPKFSENSMRQQIDAYKKIYYRIFLVLSYDQGYQNQIQNYLDKNYKLLKTMSYPAEIQLRLYQLRYDPIVKF